MRSNYKSHTNMQGLKDKLTLKGNYSERKTRVTNIEVNIEHSAYVSD